MTIALVSRALRAYFRLLIEAHESEFDTVVAFDQAVVDIDIPVADEDDKRHTVAELVRTGGWARGIGAREFVEQPVRWRTETLLVLLSV